MDDLPSFLSPLVGDTPGGQLKLLAAWDGLPIELQIGLLDAFGEGRVPGELALKAIASPNAYVRYLGARSLAQELPVTRRRLEGDGGSAAVKTEDTTQLWRDIACRLRGDPDPLVRHALDERATWPYERETNDPAIDAFLRLPLEDRLARLRAEHGALQAAERTEGFARLIHRAVTGGLVPEHEVVAMVKEYLGSPSNTEFTKWEGFGTFSPGDTLNVLLRLVLDVPKSVAEVLVARLPANTMLYADIPAHYEIPEHVLESIDRRLLERVLWRDDVGCERFRKKIVLTYQPKERLDGLISAAAQRDFDLTDEEFERLLSSDVARLLEVANAGDLRPVVLKALVDLFERYDGADPVDCADIERTYEERLRRLHREPEWKRRDYVWELRLYALAKDLASRNTDEEVTRRLSDSSEAWLREYVVHGEVWKTYRRLAAAAKQSSYGKHRCHPKWDAVLPKPEEDALSEREPYLAEVLDPSKRVALSGESAAAEKRGELYDARRMSHMLEHPEYYELREHITRCLQGLKAHVRTLGYPP
jgi:hypothetical protein